MSQSQVQETVSGFRIEGRWEDIVNTGEAVTDVMKEGSADRDKLADWEEWRPREEERLEKEVREKTVEKACVNQNSVESQGKTAVETAGEAVGDMGRAVEQATKGRKEKAVKKSRKAVKEAVLSVETAIRKSVRSFEAVVYRHIVTRTNPHYFDSELISASVNRKLRLPGQTANDTYKMDIYISDDAVREEVTTVLQESA